MTSATLPLCAQRCPRDWRTRLRSALLGSRPAARRGPAVTAVFCVATTVVVSPFVIIVSRSFVRTMDTTCADLCRSCADVVECRKHQNVAKSAVQTTLAPATRPPQSRPSLGRGSRDISYHVMAMYLAARGQCCRTEPKFRFRFPLMFKIICKNIYPIFHEANDIVSFTRAF
uniref:Uncharacterized protein n=1 Tax=Ixodes ricinus TaxID=34613 RepID=A0A6B0UZ82_IXORI